MAKNPKRIPARVLLWRLTCHSLSSQRLTFAGKPSAWAAKDRGSFHTFTAQHPHAVELTLRREWDRGAADAACIPSSRVYLTKVGGDWMLRPRTQVPLTPRQERRSNKRRLDLVMRPQASFCPLWITGSYHGWWGRDCFDFQPDRSVTRTVISPAPPTPVFCMGRAITLMPPTYKTEGLKPNK